MEATTQLEDQTRADQSQQRGPGEQIEQAMKVLHPREKTILEMRYGLHDGQTLSLDEVALYFHLTRERIRQIEAKALRKLRSPDRFDPPRDLACISSFARKVRSMPELGMS